MCAIVENRIAHDLFNYCALILCICMQKKLEWIFRKCFQATDADLDSPLISKMELFVTIINVFYQILIVSYKSIIDVAGALIFLKIGKRFTYFQTSLTYWNATQKLKDFLILGKKITNKNVVKSSQNVLIWKNCNVTTLTTIIFIHC